MRRRRRTKLRIGEREGLEHIQRGIDKLIFILEEEGHPEQQFSSAEYMSLYTTVYSMCTQKPPHDYSCQLYDKYREAFEQYLLSTVLPCLRKTQGELLLRELVKRWQNNKKMVVWLSKFFGYLDRFFIPTWSLPSFNEVALTCFRDLVYLEMNGKVAALFVLEGEGKQIDRALLKNVSDIFVELGMEQIVSLEDSFKNLEVQVR